METTGKANDADGFEARLIGCVGTVERFVRFRTPSSFDADDVLQETYIAARERYAFLDDKDNFKAWIFGIARHKCADFYRRRARALELPLDEVNEAALGVGRLGVTETNAVRETLSRLASRDQQILYLYYFDDVPQTGIAARLGVPLGTVKSRLHTAKANFRKKYPYHPIPKGEQSMKRLPQKLPAYTIERSEEEPFPVIWEELMGWFLVPKEGEKLTWGMYDMPGGELGESDEMEVAGKAEVHGIKGVEITVKTRNPMDVNSEGGETEVSRRFIAQLTSAHCRYLAESHTVNGVRKLYTFLDGEDFAGNWGFGENNCGNETHLAVKGDITREGGVVTTADKPFLIDIVGRYTVTIGGRRFDTVCVMDAGTYNPGVVSEQYLDKNGRTVLWRRFNRDDWAISRYKTKWSERLPDNERLTVNGARYVHWYDCITDYIF